MKTSRDFAACELDVEFSDNRHSNFVLDRQRVGKIAVVTFGPDKLSDHRVSELYI